MKIKTLIKKTKKEIKIEKIAVTILLSLIALSGMEILTLWNSLSELTTCNNLYDCLISDLGSFLLTIIIIGVIVGVFYLMSLIMVSDYKEKKRKKK